LFSWYRMGVAYLVRFVINVFRSLLLPLWWIRRRSWLRGAPRWIAVELSPRIVPFHGGRSALARLTAGAREHGIGALDKLRALTTEAAGDPQVRGVLFTLPPLESGWATCESLRELFVQLRAASKQVVCYLPQGGGNKELYVALAADRAYVAPYASFGPLGLAVSPVYFRPLLDRLGIRVEALASGEYKSAAEPGLRENMSDAAREQLDALLAARQLALSAALQQRGLSADEVSELFARSLILADDALASRVVDGVIYADELPTTLRALDGPAETKPQRASHAALERAADAAPERAAETNLDRAAASPERAFDAAPERAAETNLDRAATSPDRAATSPDRAATSADRAAEAAFERAAVMPSARKVDDEALEPLPAARYMRVKRRLWLPLARAQNIAIVPLHGMITGEAPGGLGSGLKESTLSPLLRALAKDLEVRAIVLHIDSPGGSALASEQMHHEIKQLARKKPVVACFGEVAASGGYYLACACNKIVAHDLCTTGSIGVVMAKVDAHDFVARLGLRPQFLRTADSADMLSPARSLTEREQSLLSSHVVQLYQRFLAVVAEGRGRSVEQVDHVARGRVWTGSAAKDHGLVDAIGSMERALSEARSLVPALSDAERAALRPRVFRVKSSRGMGLAGLLLGTWLTQHLRELAAFTSFSREAALYYAPLTPDD
jgi:protease-4